MIVNKYGGGGGGYVLPVATDSTLGGVKIGSGLNIDSGGTLSTSGGSAGGGDYVIVDALSAITNPTEGMIAYVTAHQETVQGVVFDDENYDISYQVRVCKNAPRLSMDQYYFTSKYQMHITDASSPIDFSGGEFNSIFRDSIFFQYDDSGQLTYVFVRNGYFITFGSLPAEAYDLVSTSVTIPAYTYIYRGNKWYLWEDGKISFYLDSITTQADWSAFITDLATFKAGEFQFIVDEYYYGWNTYKFYPNTNPQNNGGQTLAFGSCFIARASNGETFEALKALSLRVENGSGWKAYGIAKYDFLNPPS